LTSSTSLHLLSPLSFFFFSDPPPSEIYTLSLHDALPILLHSSCPGQNVGNAHRRGIERYCNDQQYWLNKGDKTGNLGIAGHTQQDRKSTRLNSSHVKISYAVFCLKKKKTETSRSNGVSIR